MDKTKKIRTFMCDDKQNIPSVFGVLGLKAVQGRLLSFKKI